MDKVSCISSDMPVLLVADSRGHGLGKYLQQRAPGVFVVRSKSGAGLKELFRIAQTNLKSTKYTAVIEMGGICDITQRDSEMHIATLRTVISKEVTTEARKNIKKGRRNITKIAPATPVIIAPTMGIDLTRYNGMPADPNEQETLNQIVLEMNKMIISCNKESSPIPWISKMVHHCKGRQRWAHRYQNLRDGCHFNRRLKIFIANELAKCLIKL